MGAITFPNLGISVNPSRVAFNVLGKDIYWYGIIIAAGFLLAVIYAMRRAPSFGLTEDNILDMLFVAVPLAIVCARLYYCIFYWDLYRDNPIAILYVWEGGLAIYGGVIGAVIGVAIFCRGEKLPIGPLLDLGRLGLLIGPMTGRGGHFLDRGAHGPITGGVFQMGLADAAGNVIYYQPTFLYESVWNLVGFVALHFYSKRRKFDGEVFLLYLAWYGLGRAWIEGLRTDSLYLFNTGIRVSQLLAVLSCVAAIAVLVYVRVVRKPQPEKLYVNRIAQDEAEPKKN